MLGELFGLEAAGAAVAGMAVIEHAFEEPGRSVGPAPPQTEPDVPVLNLVELRRLAVRQAMRATGGHRGRAAKLLGVSLNTMTRLVAESCPELPATTVGRKRATRPR